MITRIEACRYRCLKAVKQPLQPFELLVGPNASGKSAFLDVLAFLSAMLAEGLDAAVLKRTENFHDLVWGREGSRFQLAVEAEVPSEHRLIPFRGATEDSIRYEVEVRIDTEADAFVLAKERVVVRRTDSGVSSELQLVDRGPRLLRLHDALSNEFGPPFEFPRNLPAIRSLGGDNSPFHAAAWLDKLLSDRIQYVELESEKLRAPSPPHRGKVKKFDGSSLARLVFQLQDKSPERFGEWLAHLRTSLPDLKGIRSELQPEESKRYLILEYENGVRAPSWVVSDGTLRLLALTLLAYIPDFEGVYLIEEPENGIHPKAIETVYQSLSSVYEGQVLVASHSPILLGLAKPEEILCFRKTPEGAEIVRGHEHPLLQDWKGEISLSELFAAGVLG